MPSTARSSICTPFGRLLLRAASVATVGLVFIAPVRAQPPRPSALQMHASQTVTAIRVQSLLKEADKAMKSGHLAEPPGSNAAALYAEALRLDPHNTEARIAIIRLRDAIHAALIRTNGKSPELQHLDSLAKTLVHDYVRTRAINIHDSQVALPPPITGESFATAAIAPPASQQGSPPKVSANDIDRVIAGLPLANIAFNTPTHMRVGQTQSIQLRLSGAATVEELRKQISAEGNLTSEQIKVSDLLEVHLSGKSFTIDAVTPESQAVGTATTSNWEWEVTPTRRGPGTLHLTINALIPLNGQERKFSLRTFDRTIDVNVDWSASAGDFLASNWQWLWTAILVPLALLAWRRFRKPKADKATRGVRRKSTDRAIQQYNKRRTTRARALDP